ncbi:4'-phosphopantetheinyl transferase superfamily protein [Streptomyces olivaceus]|nr:4'-phosphopantetheinyl transferase superfamily protein [Streptomyces olivaceus]
MDRRPGHLRRHRPAVGGRTAPRRELPPGPGPPPVCRRPHSATDRAQPVRIRRAARRVAVHDGAARPPGARRAAHRAPASLQPRPRPGLAVCLLCPELDCGVDVEVTDRTVDPVRVARTMFHPRETARVLAALPAERNGVFLRHWTLKEAYGKARGLGFLLPPGSYTVTPDAPGGPRLAATDDDGPRWQLAQWSRGERHLLAVALRRDHGPDATVVRHPGPP